MLLDLRKEVINIKKKLVEHEELLDEHEMHIGDLKNASDAREMLLQDILRYVKATAEKIGAVSE